MKKWLLRIALLILVFAVGLLFWAWRNGRDRFPGYQLDQKVSAGAPAPLQVGFAALKITPILLDTWQDVNSNAQFEPKGPDTWVDVNGNGRFDAFWMAGFQNARPAQTIHDDLWARCMVVDDGTSRVAIVALDLIGFGNDDVIRVRQQIRPASGVTYAMIGSTHVHDAPDMLGIWGPSDYASGLNSEYSALVIAQAAKAIDLAAQRLRPAYLIAAEDTQHTAHLVGDTRLPIVKDDLLHCLQAIDTEADTTLGTLIVWGNHPETTWNDHCNITSDFPHYVREGIEKGIFRGDSLVQKGLGGTTVYLSGAIGGLMTTHPGMVIRDTCSGELFKTPSFDKARAEGEQLAVVAMHSLAAGGDTLRTGALAIRARSFDMPLDNTLFRLGVALDIFNRGYSKFGYLRSEVALVTLGPISFLAVPGEIYPEIVHGGIEQPPGADFSIEAQEIPPLYSEIPGKHRFVLGLMNDELGYIIPKSEWDSEAPWLYGAGEQLYGEINSCGPLSGPIIHKQLVELCREVNGKK